MVVIDSTVWIDYLGGTDTAQTLWLDHELTRQRLALTDLILCEVLQGIRDETLFIQTRDELLNFHIFQTGGKELAIAASMNYRKLQQRSYTVHRTID